MISEGGAAEVTSYGFTYGATVSAASGVRTHALSVRPKGTFNSLINRTLLVPDSVDIVVTGSSPVLWELCLGQALSGTTTYNNVNAAYSTAEYNTAGTVSGTPGVVIASGYVPATSQSKGAVNRTLALRYPITLDAAGNPRALGTLSIVLTGIGGASATRVTFNWAEVR